MYCVGLTGGIGCGKTKAADLFAALGAAVIDTDAISHELTGRGGAAMDAIRTEFGDQYVSPEGALDRTRMRELVFRDPHAKQRLEAILHPRIGAEVRTRLTDVTAAYALIVVPLLIETGSYRDLLDRLLVVDCPEAQQIERVMKRSQLTADGVRAIMAAQIPRAERLAAADDVLVNDADLVTLEGRVRALHEQYLRAARGEQQGG